MKRIKTTWDDFWMKHRLLRTLRGTLRVAACLLSFCLTALLLFSMVMSAGESTASLLPGSGAGNVKERFDMHLTNLLSDALEGVHKIEKVYWLSDTDPVAPAPNPDCFGETTDPAVLKQVLADAAELLEGQSLYFDPDRPIVPGSTVQYYLDDTIFSIVWKEAHHACVYTFCETKIAHPSQFRRFLAGDAYGTAQQFLTTEMSESVNAVTAASGDFYGYRKIGTVVYRGEICREDNALDLCMVDDLGDLHFLYAGEAPQGEALQQYIEDNSIRFNIAFGPVLVDNGVLRENEEYPVGEIIYYFSRAALCQMDSLHYLVATANKEKGYPVFPNLAEFAQVIAATGAPMAYTLDGGQTATITIDDQLVNQVSYGSQRRISDIIYFATALPDGG